MSDKLILKELNVGPWQMNTYVLVCPQTNESVLFDPGDDPDVLSAALEGTKPQAIWLTHTHDDHIGALAEMRKRLDVPVFAHPGEHANDPQADRWVSDGHRVTVGNFAANIRYAPGHIGDHIAYILEDDNRIIVGDIIFEGGPGKTWSHEGFRTTLDSLRDVVLKWPDDSHCYPGHGPSFRLGDIRPKVEDFLIKRHPRNFFGDAEW